MSGDGRFFQGVFQRRYKRFFADVELPGGEILTVHCANTGSMKNCLVPGTPCFYSRSDNPARKLPGTLEVVTTCYGNLAGVNTGRPNALVRTAIEAGTIAELRGYTGLRSEVRYGDEGSRIDLLLQGESADCYLEVKNVTLDCGGGVARFPDAVTSRGSKHLRELMAMVGQGHRAVLFFCVQLTGVDRVGLAGDIDPVYAATFKGAVDAGVEVIAWQADIDADGIRLARPLPFVD